MSVSQQPIIGNDFIKLLKQNKDDVEVIYDEESHEHAFDLIDSSGARHFVTYPTPFFIAERLKLAKKMQVAGIALWEIGQGLTCLPDLL